MGATLIKSPFFLLTRREILRLGIVGAVSLCRSPVFALEQRVGSVEELIGAATATAGDKTRNLAPAEAVLVGDIIRTGSGARLSLMMGASTKLRLGGKTELRIDSYMPDAGGEIEFIGGTVRCEQGGSAPLDSLRFKTPFGLISAQGTLFYAGPSRGAFGIFVRQGKVSVNAAGRTVVAGPGEGTYIAKQGAAACEAVRLEARAHSRDGSASALTIKILRKKLGALSGAEEALAPLDSHI